MPVPGMGWFPACKDPAIALMVKARVNPFRLVAPGSGWGRPGWKGPRR